MAAATHGAVSPPSSCEWASPGGGSERCHPRPPAHPRRTTAGRRPQLRTLDGRRRLGSTPPAVVAHPASAVSSGEPARASTSSCRSDTPWAARRHAPSKLASSIPRANGDLPLAVEDAPPGVSWGSLVGRRKLPLPKSTVPPARGRLARSPFGPQTSGNPSQLADASDYQRSTEWLVCSGFPPPDGSRPCLPCRRSWVGSHQPSPRDRSPRAHEGLVVIGSTERSASRRPKADDPQLQGLLEDERRDSNPLPPVPQPGTERPTRRRPRRAG